MTDSKPFILFILGGPGSGKGTQCARLVKDFNFVHLSAGDLLREEMAREGSEYSELISTYIKEGSVVPVEITLALLKAAMARTPDRLFLIDGYPREMSQASEFEKQITTCRAVLYFTCTEKTMRSRLLARGATSGRTDDNEDTIVKRFVTFNETSYPVIQHYQERNLVVEIDTEDTPDNVYKLTHDAVNNLIENPSLEPKFALADVQKTEITDKAQENVHDEPPSQIDAEQTLPVNPILDSEPVATDDSCKEPDSQVTKEIPSNKSIEASEDNSKSEKAEVLSNESIKTFEDNSKSEKEEISKDSKDTVIPVIDEEPKDSKKEAIVEATQIESSESKVDTIALTPQADLKELNTEESHAESTEGDKANDVNNTDSHPGSTDIKPIEPQPDSSEAKLSESHAPIKNHPTRVETASIPKEMITGSSEVESEILPQSDLPVSEILESQMPDESTSKVEDVSKPIEDTLISKIDSDLAHADKVVNEITETLESDKIINEAENICPVLNKDLPDSSEFMKSDTDIPGVPAITKIIERESTSISDNIKSTVSSIQPDVIEASFKPDIVEDDNKASDIPEKLTSNLEDVQETFGYQFQFSESKELENIADFSDTLKKNQVPEVFNSEISKEPIVEIKPEQVQTSYDEKKSLVSGPLSDAFTDLKLTESESLQDLIASADTKMIDSSLQHDVVNASQVYNDKPIDVTISDKALEVQDNVDAGITQVASKVSKEIDSAPLTESLSKVPDLQMPEIKDVADIQPPMPSFTKDEPLIKADTSSSNLAAAIPSSVPEVDQITGTAASAVSEVATPELPVPAKLVSEKLTELPTAMASGSTPTLPEENTPKIKTHKKKSTCLVM